MVRVRTNFFHALAEVHTVRHAVDSERSRRTHVTLAEARIVEGSVDTLNPVIHRLVRLGDVLDGVGRSCKHELVTGDDGAVDDFDLGVVHSACQIQVRALVASRIA